MSLVDFTVMNGGGTDYIAHAIHAPTMSWADMTIAGRDHPDRIHPHHGLSPKYLLPTQQHFPKQHPPVDEVLQELEKRLEKQPI
jgi:hypothetical protein